MRYISAAIRLISGSAIIVMAGYVYWVNQEGLSGNRQGTVALFGQPIEAEPQVILIGIVCAGVIGLALVIGGLVTLVFRRAPAQPINAETPPQSP
jgi:hypothetical protein